MLFRSQIPLDRLQASRIALIKPSALGDIVHSLPILEALRIRFPQSHITWVVNRSYEPLVQDHPALDATLSFDRHTLKHGLRAAVSYSLQFAKELRKRRFDLVVDLQGLARTGLMTLATAARQRIGLESAREGSRYCYTHLIPSPDADKEHSIDRYWRVAQALGVGDLPKRFRIAIPEVARDWANDQLGLLPRPWMVFAVGSRWLTKRWPPESFALLARTAQQNFGGTAIFVGTPDEAVLSRKVIATLAGPWQDWTGKTTLHQLAALLEAADVMIANDTGPLHLAAALGRPVVAPYTCTLVRRHGPYGAMRGAVESTIWCHGSYLKKCDRLDCMTELQPGKLWPFLNEILESCSRKARTA
jgi:lipopolysaccharide heptosyltransferase II